ncbi:MAG: hypothetical protein J6D47_09525, partial [Peptostreptococcaceae bacterium]|nr:hypothetical protein [Peptostreptococcaceae bacterium]
RIYRDTGGVLMDIMQEYEMLLNRFNKAFNYRYEENSKADIEFKKIIKRLAEIEREFKEG